jgi:hypothetical protein
MKMPVLPKKLVPKTELPILEYDAKKWEHRQAEDEAILDTAIKSTPPEGDLRAEIATVRQAYHAHEYRKQVAKDLGIDSSILGMAENETEVKAALRAHLAAQNGALETMQKRIAGEKEDDSGPLVVPLGRPTDPRDSLNYTSQIDRQIAELRKVSTKGGEGGTRARVAILRLEQEKQQGTRKRRRPVV